MLNHPTLQPGLATALDKLVAKTPRTLQQIKLSQPVDLSVTQLQERVIKPSSVMPRGPLEKLVEMRRGDRGGDQR